MSYKKHSSSFYYQPTNVYSSSGIKNRYSEVLSLPVVYVCKSCGFEIYRFSGGPPQMTSKGFGNDTLMPNEVAQRNNHSCPNCKAKLNNQPDLDLAKISVV